MNRLMNKWRMFPGRSSFSAQELSGFSGVCKSEFHPSSSVHKQQLWIWGTRHLGKRKKTVGILNCGFSKTVPGKKTGEWSVGSVD
jgi:hypothetical protein